MINDEEIYINNAGLILAGVFLPQLFKSLDMLATDSEGDVRFPDLTTFSRAVHLLQYLVDGSTSTAEYSLVLNKVLCGESPDTPIETMIEISEHEIEICTQLQHAMLNHWEKLSGSTIVALQETFFQREGVLRQIDDGWELNVARKGVDVLVDTVPWEISVISLDWMVQPVFVDW